MQSSKIPSDPHDPLVGTRIDGRYSVLGRLGRGAQAVVYEGVHDELGRPVAIKVLDGPWATEPTAVSRFLREARTASALSHSHIVDVSDLGRLSDGRPYLVMPQVLGTPLRELLAADGPQSPARVARLLAGVGSALDLIHARGLVHRDIKPENLMHVPQADGAETVVLLDFGIAGFSQSHHQTTRLTQRDGIFGTPEYMAPEMWEGTLPDGRGDVYALATVAFELITGQLPFHAANPLQLLATKYRSPAPRLSAVGRSKFPAEVEAVFRRALAREPGGRTARAGLFVTALLEAAEGGRPSGEQLLLAVRGPSLLPKPTVHALPAGDAAHSGAEARAAEPTGIRAITREAPSEGVALAQHAEPQALPLDAVSAIAVHAARAADHASLGGGSDSGVPTMTTLLLWRAARQRLTHGIAERAAPLAAWVSHARSELVFRRVQRQVRHRRATPAGRGYATRIMFRRRMRAWQVPNRKVWGMLGLSMLTALAWRDSVEPPPRESSYDRAFAAGRLPVRAEGDEASEDSPRDVAPESHAVSSRTPALSNASDPSLPHAAEAETTSLAAPPAAVSGDLAPVPADTGVSPAPLAVPPAAAVSPTQREAKPPAAHEPVVAPRSAPVADVARAATVPAATGAAATARVDEAPSDKPSSEKAVPSRAEEPKPGLVTPATTPNTNTPTYDVAKADAGVFAGTALLLKGDADAAIAHFRQVLSSAPGHASAWRGLGLAYERKQDAFQALDAYEHYLALVPDGPPQAAVRKRMRALSPSAQ